MKVSIAVLCHNRPVLAANCIESILHHTTHPFELVLLDNGSTDPRIPQLFERTAGRYRDVKILREEANIGSGPGRARALAQASGDVLITLDSDTEVTAGWDVPLIAKLCAHENTAAVGALLLDENRRVHALGGTHENLGTRYIVLSELARGLAPEDPELRSGRLQPSWLPSGAMAIKASCYARVQFPSDRFFNCFIDANYSFELTKAGFGLDVSPESVIYHLPKLDQESEAHAYAQMRSNPAVLCQSILYFIDSWGRNPMLSWQCLNQLLDRQLNLNQGEALLEEVHAFLEARKGISRSGSARLYDCSVIAECLRSIRTEIQKPRPQAAAAFMAQAAALAARRGSVYIWGFGEGGRRVAAALTAAGIDWAGFIDSDARNTGKSYAERSAFFADDILARTPRVPMVIASSYAEAIRTHLIETGNLEGADFIIAPVHALPPPSA
jgi:GT2 family glycosyltransferase